MYKTTKPINITHPKVFSYWHPSKNNHINLSKNQKTQQLKFGGGALNYTSGSARL